MRERKEREKRGSRSQIYILNRISRVREEGGSDERKSPSFPFLLLAQLFSLCFFESLTLLSSSHHHLHPDRKIVRGRKRENRVRGRERERERIVRGRKRETTETTRLILDYNPTEHFFSRQNPILAFR